MAEVKFTSGLAAAGAFAATDQFGRNTAGGSPSVRITATQLFGDQFAAVGQLKFPATQSGSSDANTLDDYEEGTFTPIDSSGAALSLTGSGGSYVKIGRALFWWTGIAYPATADGTDSLIGGFPYTIDQGQGASDGRAGAFISLRLAGASLWVETLQLESSTTIRPYKASGVRATNANLSSCSVNAAGQYMVD